MKDLGWDINIITKTWSNAGGDSQWGTDANWNPNGIPDASQDTYFTNTGLTANGTVTLGADRSVNSLSFDTTTNFTIGGAAGSLTIASGNISRTSTSSGTQTIARPIVLGNNGVWDIAGSGQLTVSGAISGSYSIRKNRLRHFISLRCKYIQRRYQPFKWHFIFLRRKHCQHRFQRSLFNNSSFHRWNAQHQRRCIYQFWHNKY